MAISYSKLFVGISLPALCTGLASLLLSISANAQTIRPTTQKELKVFDPTTGNSGNIGIRAAAGTLSYTLTLPATAPSVNQVLSASAVTGGNVSLTWATPVSGTVTSVGLSVPTGFSVSGSPVTSAGTLSLSYASGYALPTTSSQANWGEAYNDRITAASVTGTTTKTITLTQQDGGTVTATFSDLNTDAVSSVFGRTGAVTSTTGDYTTAQVTESGNFYFTDARARAAISLATTGSSGAATYSSTTGVLTIPNYTLTGLGGVGGSGTLNYLSKFATAGTLTNSLIFDNGTNVGIGTLTPTARLDVHGAFGDPSKTGTITNAIFSITSPDAFPSLFFGLHSSASGVFYSPWIQAADRNNLGNFRNLFLNPNGGNVAIGTGTLTPTARLQVMGNNVTTSNTLIVQNGSSNNLLTIRNDGYSLFGPNTTSTEVPVARFITQKFGVNNGLQLYAGGTLTTTSGDYIAIYLQENNKSAIQAGDDNAGRDLLLNPAGGNVGIGTTNPIWTLDLYKPGDGTRIHLGSDAPGKTNTYLYTSSDTNGYFGIQHVKTAGSAYGDIVLNLDGGNVGIGTTSPNSRLDINGGTTIGVGLQSGDGGFSPGAGELTIGEARGNGSSGINTRLTLINGISSAAENGNSIDFVTGTNANPSGIKSRISGFGDAGNTKGFLSFSTFNSTAIQEHMRIDNLGNVGIGTTNPTLGKLQVSGSIAMTDDQNSMLFLPRNAINDPRSYIVAGDSDRDYPVGMEFRVRSTLGQQITVMNFEGASYTGQVSYGMNLATVAGSVGIGTTDPQGDKLAVYESTASKDLQVSISTRRPNTSTSAGRAQLNFATGGAVFVGGAIGSPSTGGLGLMGGTLTVTGSSHIFIGSAGGVSMSSLSGSGNRYVTVDASGNLTATIASSSDIRLKSNIEVIPNALQKVMGLRGVTYNWKDGRDTTRVLGMIAQEVMKVAPELVFKNADGYYAIHYGETTGLLVEAIKEQQKIIEELKKTQALMAGQLRQLQADLIKKEDRGVSTAPNQ